MTLEELTTDIITGTWCPTEVRLSADATRVAWVAAPYGAAGEHDESAIWVAAPRQWSRRVGGPTVARTARRAGHPTGRSSPSSPIAQNPARPACT